MKNTALLKWLDLSGYTNAEAAAKLGVSASYLRRLIDGERRPGNVLATKLALLGVPRDSWDAAVPIEHPGFWAGGRSVAKRVGVPYKVLVRWIRQGSVDAEQVPGGWLVSYDDAKARAGR